MIRYAIFACALTCASQAHATSGGLNGEGCHNDRKYGTGYHCHNAGAPSGLSARSERLGIMGGGNRTVSRGSFANCSAARAAGAAPVRIGSVGYSRKLDRDGDGIGCE